MGQVNRIDDEIKIVRHFVVGKHVAKVGVTRRLIGFCVKHLLLVGGASFRPKMLSQLCQHCLDASVVTATNSF